jgi:glycosyltransferase involved in cell wall biosynthesis
MCIENYILITPCKNEEENLQKLAESIVNQAIKPKLWVIIDDGSTDNTPAILNNLVSEYKWIGIIRGKESIRDLGLHYSEIVNETIKHAFEMCEIQKLSFEYVGLIDADMILEKHFFEKIIERFEINPKLGVCSGSVVYIHKDKRVLEKGRSSHPIGGLRVWRKRCLEDTGGFPISYSADSVSNVLAIIRGWDTRKYDDIIGIQSRKTSSAEGFWKGYITRGKSDYYRDYHPAYVILKAIKYSSSYPFYKGIAYLTGYVNGVVIIKEKIDIPDVRTYYRSKHLELLTSIKRKIKG